LAGKCNKPVSFDLNYRALQWEKPEDCYKQVLTVLPYVDFLKISNEEVFLLGGEENLGKLIKEYDIPLLVMTRGAGISSVYWNNKEWHCPSVRKNAVDTTGAGDAFWGVFLHTLVSRGVRGRKDLGESVLQEALKRAVAAGELAILKPGAIASLPDKKAVDEAAALYD
jgi:sugar/nucleoside kinase (ribokinase family)